ncbi:MAG: hypothetical protein JWR72_2787 [Flavisolibacter sp.]|nr:hypothetical protein [Flavisolibacter sp.]
MQNILTERILVFAFATAMLFSSCGSVSSFESPNSFRNMNGTLFLRNGKSYDGKLLIQSASFISRPIKILTEGDTRPMQFNLDEVEGYRIRNDHYDLKELKGGLRLGKELSFMKRLTKEGSRIHLYEHLKRVAENSKGYAAISTRYEIEYYMQLPNEEAQEVYPLGGSRFVPNFDEKVSRLVGDCPELARKIAAKESGYFYAQVSLIREKKVDVLMNIIEEYNRCR